VADDVVSNPGVGGVTFRALLDSGGTDYWPAAVPSWVTGGSSGAWTLAPVDLTHGLPVQPGTNTTWKVDGSGVTQPISGTVTAVPGVGTFSISGAVTVGNTINAVGSVTANAGTNLNTSLLALEAGGNLSVLASAVSAARMQASVSGAVTASAGTNLNTSLLALEAGGNLSIIGAAITAGRMNASVSGALTANAGTNLNTSLLALEAGGNLSIIASAVSAAHMQASVSGAVALNSGTAMIGDVNLSATSRGGCSVSSQLAMTSSVAAVSSSAGKFMGAQFINLNSAPAFIQIFDVTSAASPSVGSTTPTFVIPIPANGTAANGAGFVLPLDVGIAIVNGIKAAATLSPSGSTTVGTGLTGFFLYK
jgi:hypothetical protein